jgi:hypothetical protein
MLEDKMCPVCGYEMAEGPRDYNICPSCGTEFGLHDVNSSIPQLREVWIEKGPRWYSSVIPPPPGWNPWLQYLRVFLRVQINQNAPEWAVVTYGHTTKRNRHKTTTAGLGAPDGRLLS